MKEQEEYFDFEVDESALLEHSLSMSMEEYFTIKDLKRRKIYFSADVDQYAVDDAVRYILQYNADDRGIRPEERRPIYLYLTTCGGDVDAGFELIDVILNSKTPVYTINLGHQYSMGFLIGLAGTKRFATRNAKYLIHDGSNFVFGSGGKVQDQVQFVGKVDQRIKEYVLECCNISEEEYESKKRVEWYMFADEAYDKGVVDYIIGRDCDLDEVI